MQRWVARQRRRGFWGHRFRLRPSRFELRLGGLVISQAQLRIPRYCRQATTLFVLQAIQRSRSWNWVHDHLYLKICNQVFGVWDDEEELLQLAGRQRGCRVLRVTIMTPQCAGFTLTLPSAKFQLLYAFSGEAIHLDSCFSMRCRDVRTSHVVRWVAEHFCVSESCVILVIGGKTYEYQRGPRNEDFGPVLLRLLDRSKWYYRSVELDVHVVQLPEPGLGLDTTVFAGRV